MLELQNHPDAPCGTDDDRVDLLDPFTVASFETLEQQLRPFAHMALETLADTNLRTRPTCTVANIAKHFTGELPLHGESLSGLAERLATTVTPFGRNKRSPRYFAQMDVPPSQLSVFAGLVIRAIAQDPIAFSSSRSGTFVEKQLTQWLSTLIYGAQPLAGGVMTTGGSQSNLQALLLLRNAAFARRVQTQRRRPESFLLPARPASTTARACAHTYCWPFRCSFSLRCPRPRPTRRRSCSSA